MPHTTLYCPVAVLYWLNASKAFQLGHRVSAIVAGDKNHTAVCSCYSPQQVLPVPEAVYVSGCHLPRHLPLAI